MLAAYERLTREVQLLDTGEGKGLPKADAPAEPNNQLGADDPGSGPPASRSLTLSSLVLNLVSVTLGALDGACPFSYKIVTPVQNL